MRHRLEFDDARGVYACTACGTVFTQDALIAEMDRDGCPGPAADEGYTVAKYDTGAGLDSSRLVDVDERYHYMPPFTYSWRNPEPTSETRPAFSDDETETKGRRLIQSAGYMCGDDTHDDT